MKVKKGINMVKKFNSWDELLSNINSDVFTIYNSCKSLNLVTDSVDSVEHYVKEFTEEMYKEYPEVTLFKVRDRYIISLVCVGNSLDGVIWKRNAIIDYDDRFILVISDTKNGEVLNCHPFIDMTLDEIVSYMRYDKILKSDRLKFKYDLIKNSKVVYSLYGSDNSVVKDYFKRFGGKNIRTSKISSNETLYSVVKDGKNFEFIIRRSSLKN